MYRLNVLAGIAGCAILAGCSLIGSDQPQAPSSGLIVGDEPFAVQAGADVLAQGGSAVDAAVATFFALAVTYPVAAGVGGGGVCIVHPAAGAPDEEIDFLPRDPSHGGAYAVPGAVSGMALIQSRYGRLPWQRDVAAGEGLASAGYRISHALEVRLAENQDVIRLDAGLAGEFFDETGRLKPEGATASNPDLAQTLSTIRTQSPARFYSSSIADKLVAYSTAQGGAISTADLQAYLPGNENASVVSVGSQSVSVPSRAVGAGTFLSAIFAHLTDAQGGIVGGDNLAVTVAKATKDTLDEFHLASLPRDLGSTGFAATSTDGQAVACAVTMNGPFGSGHTAAGTGIVLAAAPSSGKAGLSAAFLTPALVQSGGALTLAGAGSGGPNGTAALVYAILKTARELDITQTGQTHSTGLAPYETVNVIACHEGTCTGIPDPGASGLGAAQMPTN